MINKQLSLAVHLHLYYLEMWPEIKRLLANMGDYPYDLYVTMVAENSQIAEDIRAFHQNSTIWVVENRGYDIGPFIDFLHHIDLNQYDLIMKLHTKNQNRGVDTHINQYVFNRKLWFKTLIGALIGSKKVFKRNIKEFVKYPELGMTGSKYLIASDSECSKNVQCQVEKILDELGYPQTSVKFVAGTMFMCRSKLLKLFKEHYSLQDFAPTDGKIKDETLAHTLERVLGCVIVANRFKIKGFDENLPHSSRLLFKNMGRFVYQHKVTNIKYELIKVFKLTVYHRRIL